MDKKIAIVTGSEGEIGRSICEALELDSFSIIGVDEKVKESKNSYLQYTEGSVVDLNVVNNCFDLVTDSRPSELVLINCAGITLPNDLSLGAWEKTLAVNLTAPFIWMTRAAEYFELEKISGSIVSITSLSAELAFPGNPAYSASKGGLRQLTKSFAHRLGRLGICCNNVAPGYIETNFNSKSIHDEKRYATRAQHSLLQRWGKPREIADMVRFLCSENSRFISGQDFFVDGGWSSQGLIEYE